MPRYHFDLESDLRLFRDEKGSEMPDDQTAREEALIVIPDIVRTMLASRGQHKITSLVRDEVGTIIFGVKVSLVESEARATDP